MKLISYIKFVFSSFGDLLFPKLNPNAFVEPKLNFQLKKRQLAIASLTINLMALALPILILQVYDRLLVSHNIGTARVLAVGLIVVTIFDAIIRISRSYIVNWAGSVYEHTIYSNLLRHMLSVEQNSVESLGGIGSRLQRMRYISSLRDFFSGHALIVFVDLPFVLIFLGLIYYLAGILVLVPIGVICVFGFFTIDLGENLREILKKREDADEERMGFIIEALSGIHTIKSMALEAFFQRRYERYQLETSKANLSLSNTTIDMVNYSGIFTQIIIVGIVAIGAPMAMQGEMTLGTLIACVLLSARIMQPLQKAMTLWGKYQNFLMALDSVNEGFEFPLLDRANIDDLPEKEGCLEIKNLSFSYGANKPVLSNVNFNIKAGDFVSISGDRSTGKTTLLKLVAGVYKAYEGDVLIDGLSSSKYPDSEIVKHLGLLSMNGVIFRGTIWDNLSAFGEYDEDAVKDILELLNLDDDIKKLPEGYQTKLGGTQSDIVPSGLKQRIAIARSLVPEPKLILFDNADRSLDKDGYDSVYNVLKKLKGKASIVVVTEDFKIRKLAEKEYTLLDGELVTVDLLGDDSA